MGRVEKRAAGTRRRVLTRVAFGGGGGFCGGKNNLVHAGLARHWPGLARSRSGKEREYR